MKKLLVIILCTCGFSAFSQSKGHISFGVAFGDNDMVQFKQLVGAGSHSGKGFYSLEFNYQKPLNRFFDFETGLAFGNYNFLISGAPGVDFEPVSEKTLLFTIPVTVRVNFLKYFFVNVGALMDMDFSNSSYLDNQTGVGAKFGVGIQYRLNSGMGFFIYPNLRAHSLAPFLSANYQERLFESSIQFGVSYKL